MFSYVLSVPKMQLLSIITTFLLLLIVYIGRDIISIQSHVPNNRQSLTDLRSHTYAPDIQPATLELITW